jgi:alpha-N-arabinofuranosidase
MTAARTDQASGRRLRLGRRDFVKTASIGALALLAPRTSRAADARIEVLVGKPVGTIAPEIYGHFTEHIGGVVYDGIWVGEDSKVPNVGGIHLALVDHMKRIRPPVVRWPGGCFADSYDWRDGVGPRDKRPRRTNFWVVARGMRTAPVGPQHFDPNQFGTHEFVRFCRLVGAEPYISANVRGLSAADIHDHNTFDDPRAVEPKEVRFRAQGERLAVTYPPASVSLLRISL